MNHLFQEIKVPATEGDISHVDKYVEVYIVKDVEPTKCGAMVKRLSQILPLGGVRRDNVSDRNGSGTDNKKKNDVAKQVGFIDLLHLKRVRRTRLAANVEGDKSSGQSEENVSGDIETLIEKNECIDQVPSVPCKKKPRLCSGPKGSERNRLDVLVGPIGLVDSALNDHIDKDTEILDIMDQIKYLLEVFRLEKIQVPARLPECEMEWKEFNNVWPTGYFPNKTKEFKEKDMALTEEEIDAMQKGMEQAFMDAVALSKDLKSDYNNISNGNSPGRPAVGTVIISPETGLVLARSHEEQIRQGKLQTKNEINPLQTSILFAIQAMSRRERDAAIKHGIDSTSFQDGQYLCTGLDVYTTHEPSVFEAMSLVHARIRRLVFGCPAAFLFDRSQPTLKGITEAHVHSLPGTNHKYRAFQCCVNSDISKRCSQL